VCFGCCCFVAGRPATAAALAQPDWCERRAEKNEFILKFDFFIIKLCILLFILKGYQKVRQLVTSRSQVQFLLLAL
jgi:hypothetical protein